ncbi:uncharacterized protein LOC135848123 isoform X2 [Planococcus citri]
MSTNQTHEGNRIVGSSNDRFVYLYNVPNLQEITSYQVAQRIWCSGSEKIQLENEQDCSHQERFVQLRQDLNIPSCIGDILENELLKVDRRIKQWGQHFLFYMEFPKKFSKYDYDIPSIDPNWFVWSMNGEIDCRKTAKNMLQVDCLTNVHKFIIMSVYCLEEEMKEFSLDSLPAEFYANMTRSNGWVFFYWICYLRNELCKVAYYALAVNFNIRDRFINYYFWSLSSDYDQVAIAKDWIYRAFDEYGINDQYYNTSTCAFLEQTISKMNCNQQRRLFAKLSDIGMGIFSFFMCYSDSPRCALCIWRHTKNHIKEIEFSVIILQQIFRTKRNPALMSSLVEIWDTASDSQRNYLIHVQSRLCSYIHCCLDGPSLLEFVNKLLYHFSSEERKKLIFKVAESPFFFKCSSESFNFLVNSFLPDFKDQLALKEFVLQSRHFKKYLYGLLIRDQEYEKFAGKIKFYCSYDARTAQVFTEQFLKKELRAHSCEIGLITDVNKWNKFSEFIDETFENDLTSRLVVKRKFVSRMATFAYKNSKNFEILYNRFDDLVKVVEMVFVDDELKKVKRSFFIPYEQLLLRFRDHDRSNPYFTFFSGEQSEVTSVALNYKMFNEKLTEWWSKDDIEK